MTLVCIVLALPLHWTNRTHDAAADGEETLVDPCPPQQRAEGTGSLSCAAVRRLHPCPRAS